MKYCPSCLNQYTDLTLKFCLQDGTPLSAAPQKQSTIDTVAFSHPVTVQKMTPTADLRIEQPVYNRTQQNFRPEPEKKKSSKGLIAVAIIFPILTLGVVGGGAGWIYFSRQQAAAQKQETDVAAAENATSAEPAQIKPPVPETLKPEEAKSDETPPVDAEAVKGEIKNLVERWKDLTEGHNAEKLSEMYGEKVEYMGKAGVSSSEIKSNLQKTFDAYSEIDIEITNMMVAVDAQGSSATALFDKEWSYEANPKLTEGKAHTKLHLQRAGKDWKIVTEKQLKVYYVEN